MKVKRKKEAPKGTSITIELSCWDMNATLNQFAKKLRDTADILDHICCARPSNEDDFLSSGQMMIDFDHAIDPLRAYVRIETPFGNTDGQNGLFSGITTRTENNNSVSSVEVFKSSYDFITKAYPQTITIKELAELSVIRKVIPLYAHSKNLSKKDRIQTMEEMAERMRQIEEDIIKRSKRRLLDEMIGQVGAER